MTAPAGGRPDPRLQSALQHHQAGRLQEAEALYRQILADNPNHADALHLLGLLAAGAGKAAEGAALIGKALALDPAFAQAHYNLGSLRQQQDDPAAAEACYREAVRLAPDYAAAYYNLAGLLRNADREEEAIAAYRRVLEITPKDARALTNLGILLRYQDNHDDAIACFEEALVYAPGTAEAAMHLGDLRRARKEWPKALAAYRQATALQPNEAGSWLGLAVALRHQGEAWEAAEAWRRGAEFAPENMSLQLSLVEYYREAGNIGGMLTTLHKALKVDRDNPNTWRLFADSLRQVRLEAFDPGLKQDLLEAFGRRDLDHQNLFHATLGLLRCDPALADFFTFDDVAPAPQTERRARLAAATPDLADPLLLALIEKTILPDPDLETILTALRQALLECALTPESTDRLLAAKAFCFALAAQCHLNEYLYGVTIEEEGLLAALELALAGAHLPTQESSRVKLALLACYEPLHKLPNAGQVTAAARESDDPALRALLRRHIEEPMREATLAKHLDSLESIDDPTSRAVRAQYEENPYPRWATLGHFEGDSLENVMGHLFPDLLLETLPARSPLQVLIAGCGTGRHALTSAQLYADSEVLAVDLSRASLAYAMRKATELKIDNLDFLQADILNLGKLDRQFDVIECSGALHHMADPLAGWRVLCGRLAPGGVMKIALYSEAARQNVVAARDLIAAEGYDSSAAGIRRCRADILTRSGDPLLQRLAAGRDFYSLSLCRDLIFHVQEHRFSLPQIGDCLAELNLEFIGFEFTDPRSLPAYRSRFPDDPHATSLANWHIFEQENPDTFAEMYQFWVRAKK